MISFCFRLYLMLHACAARFDVTGNLENFLDFEVNKQGLSFSPVSAARPRPAPPPRACTSARYISRKYPSGPVSKSSLLPRGQHGHWPTSPVPHAVVASPASFLLLPSVSTSTSLRARRGRPALPELCALKPPHRHHLQNCPVLC